MTWHSFTTLQFNQFIISAFHMVTRVCGGPRDVKITLSAPVATLLSTCFSPTCCNHYALVDTSIWKKIIKVEPVPIEKRFSIPKSSGCTSKFQRNTVSGSKASKIKYAPQSIPCSLLQALFITL